MTRSKILLPILAAILAIACKNMGFEKTKSGLEYKIYPGGKGKETLKPGQFVKLHYKVTYNDSIVTNSYDFIPGYDMVDSVGRFHDFSEILTKLHVGDSAVCLQNYDTMFAKNPMGIPPFMKKGGKLKMSIRILDVLQTRELAMADFEKEIGKVKEAEIALLERHLAVKKVNAEKVNNSVFVEIQSQGDGPLADSGKLVGIMYTGYTLEGKYFDSNMDSTKQIQKHPMDTFYFASKQGGAVPGMLEGITRFRKGAKGRMYIPSLMAYGPQGNPPVIKPRENLVFDIHVVEVKDMPKQAAGPGPMMPQ
jgi:FKBP-type peptidyl-prolyl cis-trans isomerase FkpA